MIHIIIPIIPIKNLLFYFIFRLSFIYEWPSSSCIVVICLYVPRYSCVYLLQDFDAVLNPGILQGGIYPPRNYFRPHLITAPNGVH